MQSASAAYSGTMEESQLLSSVYFDSPDAVTRAEAIPVREDSTIRVTEPDLFAKTFYDFIRECIRTAKKT